MSDQTFKRLNVSFQMNAYEALEKIAKERGKSITDVLRDAIALEQWVHEELKAGSRILIERDGNIRELLIR